jgi:hypothetical protein
MWMAQSHGLGLIQVYEIDFQAHRFFGNFYKAGTVPGQERSEML